MLSHGVSSLKNIASDSVVSYLMHIWVHHDLRRGPNFIIYIYNFFFFFGLGPGPDVINFESGSGFYPWRA